VHRIEFRDLVNGYGPMDLLAKVQDFAGESAGGGDYAYSLEFEDA
jgi:hypothetical protein